MTSIRIRPRFRQIIPGEQPAEVQDYLLACLDRENAPCVRGNHSPGFLVIMIPPSEQHFWSPQLSIEFEEHEKGTLIRGLYGPNPSIWALFAFGYATIGVMTMFISIISFSAISLGSDSPFVWLLPFFVLAGMGLYALAQFGQKLGSEQTFRIHHFLEEALESRIRINLF
ncbi:MAG: hypothetical protein ACFCUI_13870 [Bernardetiaceae bacterium]